MKDNFSISKKIVYIAIIVLVIIAIVGGYFYYRVRTKTKFVPSPTANTQKTNYDGTYSGNSAVAYGISNATVIVSGNQITGQGTYLGSYNASISISITGRVDETGNITGDLSGSGTVSGDSVTGIGTYSGKITGNIMSVSYFVVGSGGGTSETHPGTMDLMKK